MGSFQESGLAKDWRDRPDPSTPTDALAFEDMEGRLAAYADLIVERGHRRLTPYVVSMLDDWYVINATTNVGTANNHLGYVCRVPVTGVLRDIVVYVHTQNGNVAASVYDFAAGAGNRDKRWGSGPVACPAQGWRVIGDPQLPVVEGELITLGFGCDNLTATFGRYSSLSSAVAADLPAAFAPEGSIRFTAVKNPAFPDPGDPWAAPAGTTLPIIVVGRVDPD